MKIAICSTHSFPITSTGTITHTGDSVITGLIIALEELGHEVVLVAGEGSYIPNGGLLPMQMSFGKYPPSSNFCEKEAYNNHKAILHTCDIVHDFSVTKCITECLYQEGYKNIIQTLMGGCWRNPGPPYNLVVWSQSHRNRVLRGVTDFENSPFPKMGGENGYPVKDAYVCFGGIDTNFYHPSNKKENFFLFVGRWHEVRGHKFVIELAKQTGIELVIAGENPENELFESQKQYAFEIINLAKNLPNVHFEFLPKDPNHHIYKRNLMQQAKAGILPTQFNEPFGLTMSELLACGTSVITTNYGSMPEVITNGKTGFICDNTIESFTEMMSKINDIDSKICREEAVNRFDRKIMAQNYILLYNHIINGNNW